jgi:hypothetical protein
MTTLKSFGCSFIYGSELSDDISKFNDTKFSKLAWPALIASKLNLNYECFARPGVGNFKIYCDILANSFPNNQSIYLINWTWIDRFDYVNHSENWNTLRPAEESELEKFYYQNLHSQLCDMITSSSYIVSAANHLNLLGIPYIMTYMDYSIMDTIDPTWHNPNYLKVLQSQLKKTLTNFDDKNFLDWSKSYNYPVTDSWHPLESAHQAAADYWLPAVKQML